VGQHPIADLWLWMLSGSDLTLVCHFDQCVQSFSSGARASEDLMLWWCVWSSFVASGRDLARGVGVASH
jgi:hypothetical protein